MLQLAQWPDICQDPDMALVDPMCGSGTLLIEAALMATNTAPGGWGCKLRDGLHGLLHPGTSIRLLALKWLGQG